MRVLLTGGSGFIGSNLCRHLVKHCDAQVLNADALTYAANPKSLQDIADNKNYAFQKLDICHREGVSAALDTFKPDAFVHLAAESHVDRSIDGSDLFVRTNVLGTHACLEAARAYWMRLNREQRALFRFIHVSTDEVYGSLGANEYFVESTRYDPSSPYSASKASSDHLASAWQRTYELPVIISNCSNNYGPYQFPEKLIPLMILNARDGEPLPVYGDGLNIRDWLYVNDHVRGLVKVMQVGRPGEKYNLGGRTEKTNREVVEAICKHMDELRPEGAPHARLIKYVTDRPGHDRRYAIDCTKAERELDWKPLENFDSGLAKTVQWYLGNEEWWRPLRSSVYDGKRLGLNSVNRDL